MIIARATEVKNNFGKYMKHIFNNEEVIITKHGKQIARIMPVDKVTSYLSESLVNELKVNNEDTSK